MENVYPGMAVEDASGLVGTVQAIERGRSGGEAHIFVMRHDGTRMVLTPGMFSVVGDVLHLVAGDMRAAEPGGFDPYRTQALPTETIAAEAGSELRSQETTVAANRAELRPQESMIDIGEGQEMRIPVIREEAVVRTRQVERGGVRVHKTVNEREEVIEQPTYQEQVQVERVAIGQPIQAMPEVREEGDTLIIPVVEEMLVVEKRLVLKEEVRITRRRTQTNEQARVVLREEQVTIEPLDDRSSSSLEERASGL